MDQSKTAFALIGCGIITIVVVVSLLLIGHETKTNCTAGPGAAYPNRAGFVATIHGLECGGELAGEGYETISVFVHRIGAQNDAESTAFEFIATARGNLGSEPPLTHWNGPRSLTITLRPDDIEKINVQKQTIGDVHIRYVIQFDCSIYTESSIESKQGYAGTLRVSSCSSTAGTFTYYYSVFVHKTHGMPSTSNLVFKYRATRYGAEFGTPELKWNTPLQLTITLDQGSIDHVYAKKALIQNVKVYYEYRSHH